MSESIKNLKNIKDIFSVFGPLCNSEGFYQHTGQCWSDSLQMIMLYCDGIKEFIQPRLILEPIEKGEIFSKFMNTTINLLVMNKLIEPTDTKNPFVDKNLLAIYNYFLAVQARFYRHYIAEYKRLQYLGPVECDNYDKIGNEALEFLKELSKSSRSQEIGVNKPGIRSAIMGKTSNKYLQANRELIGKAKNASYGTEVSKKYYPGGSTMEIKYLIDLYSIYFKIQFKTIDYDLNNFDTSFRSNGIYIVSSLLNTTSTNTHAQCFYTCGSTDFYYDDNEGVFEFPWHNFLFEYRNSKFMNPTTEIRFAGTYTLIDKNTLKEVFQYKTVPVLYSFSNVPNKKESYTYYFKGQSHPITISFDLNEEQKEIQVPFENFIQKLVLHKNHFAMKALSLIGIQAENKSSITSKFNMYTGKAFTSRLQESNSTVIKGIKNKNINLIKKGLDEKGSIRSKNNNDNTVLHTAIELNDIGFVKYLIEQPDIDINAQNSSGYTPLMLAVLLGPLDIAFLLLEIGSDITIQIPKSSTSNPGFTVVDLAIQKSNSLYKNFVEKNQRHEHVKYNQLLDFINACLQKDSNLQKYAFSVKNTLSSNNIDIIKIFVKNGFNMNQVLLNLYHPIEIAASNENFELFQLLLDLIPSIDELTKQNISIMNNVISGWRNEDVGKAIDSLVKKGYDPAKTFFGTINYLWTSHQNPNAFFHLLQTYNLDVNSISRDGDSLLILLTKLSEYDFSRSSEKVLPVLEMMEEVLKHGAIVNFQEKRTGNTALMFAAKIPNAEKIKLLCKYGADPTLKNKDNHDVYWFIQESLKTDPDEKQAIKEAIQICKNKQRAKRASSTIETAPSAEVAPETGKLGGFTRKRQKKRHKTRKLK